jgi:hypothetical protein
MNKKILIGIGALALIGGVYYIMKSKKDAELKSSAVAPSSETDEETASTPPATTPEGSIATPIVPMGSKKEIRKQGRADKKTYQGDCGTRPTLRKNRPAWQKCVDEQKLKQGSSFDGTKSMDIFSDISGGFGNMDIL